ncbi:unnamed protein product [Polarella glacialis]|uniref:Carrier domain-containing protein n=1 Tax=Polarella glacialis TaxID=89957 RepID=A0A813FIU8_POLGL|nr:unnamed protein product [Polarella glacialis]CAE8622651.1 unnamed protein product [Polarella glacialis]
MQDDDVRRAIAMLESAARHIDEEEGDEAERVAGNALEILRAAADGEAGSSIAESLRLIASARAVRGDRQGALKLVAEELAAFRSSNNHRGEAVMLLALAEIGNSRCGSKKREEALEAARQAISLFQQLGDRRMEALAQLALAHVHVQKGTKGELLSELESAVKVASTALTQFLEVGDRNGEGKAVHTIAVALFFQGNVDGAVKRAGQLVPLWRELGCRRLEALEQACVSEWELRRHQPQEALKAAQAAMDALAQNPQEAEAEEGSATRPARRSTTGLVQAANAYFKLGKSQEALLLAEDRLAQARQDGDFDSEILVQMALISAYLVADKVNEAVQASAEALQTIRRQDPQTRLHRRWEAEVLQLTAKVHLLKQNLQQAEQVIQEALQLAEREKDRKGLASVWLMHSSLSLSKKEHRMALKSAMRSRDFSRKFGSRKGEALALLALCSAHCSRGELKRGAAVTVEAQRIFNAIGDRAGEAEALRIQAEVRMVLQDFPRAVAAARRGRELQREICRKSEAWAAVQVAQALLHAAMAEEKQEMERRRKAKEQGTAGAHEEGPGADWFADEDQQERPAKAAYDRALQAAKDALSLARPWEDESLLCRGLLASAGAHYLCLEPEAAARSVDEGLPLAQRHRDASAEANFCLLQAQLAYSHNRPQEARDLAHRTSEMFAALQDGRGQEAAKEVLERVTPKSSSARRGSPVGGEPGYEEVEEEYWEEVGGSADPEPFNGPSKDVLSATVTDVALSLIGVESLDADEPLMDAGLDSLAAVEFQNTLSKEFNGVSLPSTLMFDFPSVKLLSDFIDGSLRESHSQQQALRGGGQVKQVRRTRIRKVPVPGYPGPGYQAPLRQGSTRAEVFIPEPYKGPAKDVLSATVTDVALSLIGVESLDADEPLMDAGLDSLAAVEFQNTLSKEFNGVSLPSTLMFDFPSVKLLSDFIDGSLRESHSQQQALRGQQAQESQASWSRAPTSEPSWTNREPSWTNRESSSTNREPSWTSASSTPGHEHGASGRPSTVAAVLGPYKGPTVEQITDMVKETALSLIGVESLDADEPLMDAGLDSLAAVEFQSAVSKDFKGIELPSTLMFDFPSVTQLAQLISGALHEAHENQGRK